MKGGPCMGFLSFGYNLKKGPDFSGPYGIASFKKCGPRVLEVILVLALFAS